LTRLEIILKRIDFQLITSMNSMPETKIKDAALAWRFYLLT